MKGTRAPGAALTGGLMIAGSLASAAFAQGGTTPAKSGFEVWMPAVAALVGGLLSGILAPFIKDYFILRWNERRTEFKAQEQIETSYLAPLSAAGEKLIWRFKELLLDGRSQFLLLRTHPQDYNEYKRRSTLYRIASLLGWIRAVNLELNALPTGGFGTESRLFQALRGVQSSLADGHNVEERRLRLLCEFWNIDLRFVEDEEIRSLAHRLEIRLYELGGDEIKNHSIVLRNSPLLRKQFICKGLAECIRDAVPRMSLNEADLFADLDGALDRLVFRESLIYREWQEALDDAVITKDPDSAARKYRIIGFEAFEVLLTEAKFAWVKPLKDLIEDVDFENPNSLDERMNHFRDFTRAVSAMLVAIAESGRSELVNAEALKQARQLITKLSAK